MPTTGDEDQLRLEVEAFAADLTATVRAAVGDHVDPFRALAKAGRDRPRSGVAVRQHPGEGIVLAVDGVDLLKLKVSMRCIWDHKDKFLAVDRSKFEVLAIGDSEPLIRFEFLRQPAGDIPSAHIQVHAHRDAATFVMARCGDGSRRGRRRATEVAGGDSVPRLAQLHLPVGGHRFRPCLEDVLEMLIDEFGVDATDGARGALAQGRADWRRKQLAAAVRDSAETAARVLEDMDYRVHSPEAGPVPDRDDRLTAR